MCELQDYIFNVYAKHYFQQLVSEISLCIFLFDLGIKKKGTQRYLNANVKLSSESA